MKNGLLRPSLSLEITDVSKPVGRVEGSGLRDGQASDSRNYYYSSINPGKNQGDRSGFSQMLNYANTNIDSGMQNGTERNRSQNNESRITTKILRFFANYDEHHRD
ncbi:MAG TPA: hypothetical protein VF905_03355, partial [Nitrospirota bacterium]